MLSSLARFCVRRRRIVVFGIWIPLFFIVAAVSGAMKGDFRTDFVLPSSESREVQELLEKANPNKAGFSATVVFKSEEGLNAPGLKDAMASFLNQVGAIEGVDTISPYDNPQQVSQSGKIAFARLDISNRSQAEGITFSDEVQEIGDATLTKVSGVQVEYGGEIFVKFAVPESEALGILAAIVILVLAFGSVLAMGLPIGTALLGLGIAVSTVTILSHATLMPDFTTSMVAMVGLGVGIDYALFIVTRYREGLQAGMSVEKAVVDAVDTSGRAVLFAGVTVIISLLGLYVMGLSFVRGLATGAAIGVLVMMLASVTLLPALLGMVKTSHRCHYTCRYCCAHGGCTLRPRCNYLPLTTRSPPRSRWCSCHYSPEFCFSFASSTHSSTRYQSARTHLLVPLESFCTTSPMDRTHCIIKRVSAAFYSSLQYSSWLWRHG
jgi:putative drug exporter of the RND superfamily